MPVIIERSNIFAFRCIMGIPLNRPDFNSALGRATTVKQTFITEENGEHLVCMRLQHAIPRSRFINMLRDVNSRNGSNLNPVPGATWRDAVFMGDELRNGGGRAIRDTLIRHMRSGNIAYKESIAGFMRHNTHMLQDELRSRITEGGSLPESPHGPAGPDGHPLFPRENSPVVDPPLPQEDVAQEALVVPPLPQEGAAQGAVARVRSNIELAGTIVEIMRDLYNIPPGYDIRTRLDQIYERVVDVLHTVSD